MTKFIKINFYYFLLLFILIVNFNTFEKIYLIYLNDYDKRLKFAYGNCDREGYGFVKKNINDEILKSNFFVENKEDYPSIKGFFYNFKNYGKKKQQSYLFLINEKKETNIKNNFQDYRVIKNEGNCYLLKKND